MRVRVEDDVSVAALKGRLLAAMDRLQEIHTLQNKLEAETHKLLREIMQIILASGRTLRDAAEELNFVDIMEYLAKAAKKELGSSSMES